MTKNKIMNKANIIEILRFRTKEGVNQEEFLAEITGYRDYLLANGEQIGYVSGQTAISADGEYLDVSYWCADLQSTDPPTPEMEAFFNRMKEKIDEATLSDEYFEIFSDTKTPANYLVTERYETEFTNPITLTAGEKVTIGEDPDPEMNPDTWINWEYCIKSDGSNAGFVPRQIIEIEGEHGIILENYSAKEMTVEKGEIVEGIKELNGWLWAKNKATGEIGWIPLEVLEVQ
jgi:hypothetical protein